MMGVVYNLPIPFWMYAFSASAALALSFLVVGYTITGSRVAGVYATVELAELDRRTAARLLAAGRTVALFALMVTILAGLVGPANPFANFSVTFFWVIFLLGFSYSVAFVGDVYALINPWQTIAAAVNRLPLQRMVARRPYPAWLGYYPALAMYMAFIWIELFGHPAPKTLAVIFIAYGLINVTGAAVFGPAEWFRHGEFFGVFLRLIGKMAPVEYVAAPGTDRPLRLRLRAPFVGLLDGRADHFSLLLFVLFMLSSTAFDGIHDTVPWVGLFWKGLYPVLNSVVELPYLVVLDFYYGWQWLMLFVSPFVYLAVYLLFVWMMKRATGSNRSVTDLAMQFAFSLVPIAVVYHVTHYYTLLVDQGPAFLVQISDPLGLGWNLFGTARQTMQQIILLASSVWHTQVALILVGHIAGVYLAHLEALHTFGKVRRALASQLPMLVLMMLFTTMGLWILSLPIAAGQVQDPVPTMLPDPLSGSPQKPACTSSTQGESC
jgi:hypothetical protein